MKLTNTSNKVIGINETYLLPDQSIELDETLMKLPAIKTYERLGLVKLDNDEAEFKAAVDAEIRRRAEAAAKAELEARAEEKAAAGDVNAPVQDAEPEAKPAAAKRSRSKKSE